MCFQPNEQDEKFRKLQFEKDNLQLQVQVLTEQIEAQTDKIADLEKMLMEKKQLLVDTEDKLQREVLSRSSLETQKLEMMSIVSELKLQQAAMERENMELRSQFNNNGDVKKPPLVPRMAQTSTPVHHSSNQVRNGGWLHVGVIFLGVAGVEDVAVAQSGHHDGQQPEEGAGDPSTKGTVTVHAFLVSSVGF